MPQRSNKPPTAAFCEDVDEGGRTLPETRISASANVAVKRSSKPDLDAGQCADGSIANDSGYSSRSATVASAPSDQKYGTERPRRVSLRLDTSMHPLETRDRPDQKPQHVQRGHSSHGSSTYSKTGASRQSNERHPPGTCRRCDELYSRDEMERLSSRFSREAKISSAPETRPVPTTQQAPRPIRPNARRSSSSSRPASADYSNLARSLPHERDRTLPPSAWANLPSPAYAYPPPSPQYTLPPTPVHYFSAVPYSPHPVSVYAEPRASLPPLQRRQTMYGSPLIRQDSQGSVGYSATPIRDNRLPDYHFVSNPFESVSRRHHEEEARREMPPPARPRLGRSDSSSASVHQAERPRTSTRDPPIRRPSDVEPVSATTVRPPTRKSVSYDVDTRRHSVDYSTSRHPTFERADLGTGFEAKVHYAEGYQRDTDVHPRVPLTPESVKRSRVPSNAGSHRSRGSRESGHKSGSSSSHKNGGFTIMKGDLTLDINNTKNHQYRVNDLEKGISITVDETRSRTGSTASVERRSRNDKHSRKSSRDIAVAEGPGQYPSRARHSFWGRRDGTH